MRVRNNNPLDLDGMHGEQITITVNATGTVHLVNFDLDGTPMSGNPFSFTLDRNQRDPSILIVFCTFSNPNGGVYEIQARGSQGGFAQHTIAQLFGEPANAVAFTFDVV